MLFLHFKGPDGSLLSSVVPHAWWPGNDTHKDSFDEATMRIHGAIKQVECMFAKMLDTLISGRHLKKFFSVFKRFYQSHTFKSCAFQPEEYSHSPTSIHV